MLYRIIETLLIAGAVLGLILIFAGLTSGCTRMMEVDKLLWQPPIAPGVDPDPGQAPPIIQIIAGALALFGFGGMAAWVRKISNNSATKCDLDELKAETPRKT